jgi:uncharacterized phiE125 gp8 family phage protein
MRYVLERVSGPATEPVTLAEAKRHLREFSTVTDNDADITALIQGAREWVEEFTGRALIEQQWRLSIGDQALVDTVSQPARYCAPRETLGTEIYLRKSPALAIVSFVSVDAAGVETAVDADSYALRDASSRWPRVVALNGANWSTGVYKIVFRAGYADTVSSPAQDASVVPERYKQAMKLWIEAMYDRDERMMETLLKTAEGLIRGERVELGFA